MNQHPRPARLVPALRRLRGLDRRRRQRRPQDGGEDVPDLVVLDVMLPDMDGFTVARRLRERDVTTPILFPDRPR